MCLKASQSISKIVMYYQKQMNRKSTLHSLHGSDASQNQQVLLNRSLSLDAVEKWHGLCPAAEPIQ